MKLEEWKLKFHRFLNRDCGTILVYHSVVRCSLGFDMWTHMPLERFEAHMRFLEREANVISLRALVQAIERRRMPANAVAVTFDDGFMNNYTRAFPVLQRYKIPATIFLTTGFVGTQRLLWSERVAYQFMRTEKPGLLFLGRKQHLATGVERRQAYVLVRDHLKRLSPVALEAELTALESVLQVRYRDDERLLQEWLPLQWSQVQEMAQSGLVDFGGHSVDHHILGRLGLPDAERQITGCREALDENLPQKSPFWAHPNGQQGDFSAEHVAMLQKNGFTVIATAIPAYISRDSVFTALGRWGIGSGDGVEMLEAIISGRRRWEALKRGDKARLVLGLSTASGDRL